MQSGLRKNDLDKRTKFILAITIFSVLGCNSDRPPEWGYIHETILRPSCATVSCHSSTTAHFDVQLDSKESAYRTLLGKDCSDDRQDPSDVFGYVVPFEPDRSTLMFLLRNDGVPKPMPPDYRVPAPDVELIEAWIAAGALCD